MKFKFIKRITIPLVAFLVASGITIVYAGNRAVTTDKTYEDSGRKYISVWSDQNEIVWLDSIDLKEQSGDNIVTEVKESGNFSKTYWNIRQRLENSARSANKEFDPGWRTSTQMMCTKLLPYVPEIKALPNGQYDIDTKVELCFTQYPRIITYLTHVYGSDPINYTTNLSAYDYLKGVSRNASNIQSAIDKAAEKHKGKNTEKLMSSFAKTIKRDLAEVTKSVNKYGSCMIAGSCNKQNFNNDLPITNYFRYIFTNECSPYFIPWTVDGNGGDELNKAVDKLPYFQTYIRTLGKKRPGYFGTEYGNMGIEDMRKYLDKRTYQWWYDKNYSSHLNLSPTGGDLNQGGRDIHIWPAQGDCIATVTQGPNGPNIQISRGCTFNKNALAEPCKETTGSTCREGLLKYGTTPDTGKINRCLANIPPDRAQRRNVCRIKDPKTGKVELYTVQGSYNTNYQESIFGGILFEKLPGNNKTSWSLLKYEKDTKEWFKPGKYFTIDLSKGIFKARPADIARFLALPKPLNAKPKKLVYVQLSHPSKAKSGQIDPKHISVLCPGSSKDQCLTKYDKPYAYNMWDPLARAYINPIPERERDLVNVDFVYDCDEIDTAIVNRRDVCLIDGDEDRQLGIDPENGFIQERWTKDPLQIKPNKRGAGEIVTAATNSYEIKRALGSQMVTKVKDTDTVVKTDKFTNHITKEFKFDQLKKNDFELTYFWECGLTTNTCEPTHPGVCTEESLNKTQMGNINSFTQRTSEQARHEVGNWNSTFRWKSSPISFGEVKQGVYKDDRTGEIWNAMAGAPHDEKFFVDIGASLFQADIQSPKDNFNIATLPKDKLTVSFSHQLTSASYLNSMINNDGGRSLPTEDDDQCTVAVAANVDGAGNCGDGCYGVEDTIYVSACTGNYSPETSPCCAEECDDEGSCWCVANTCVQGSWTPYTRNKFEVMFDIIPTQVFANYISAISINNPTTVNVSLPWAVDPKFDISGMKARPEVDIKATTELELVGFPKEDDPAIKRCTVKYGRCYQEAAWNRCIMEVVRKRYVDKEIYLRYTPSWYNLHYMNYRNPLAPDDKDQHLRYKLLQDRRVIFTRPEYHAPDIGKGVLFGQLDFEPDFFLDRATTANDMNWQSEATNWGYPKLESKQEIDKYASQNRLPRLNDVEPDDYSAKHGANYSCNWDKLRERVSGVEPIIKGGSGIGQLYDQIYYTGGAVDHRYEVKYEEGWAREYSAEENGGGSYCSCGYTPITEDIYGTVKFKDRWDTLRSIQGVESCEVRNDRGYVTDRCSSARVKDLTYKELGHYSIDGRYKALLEEPHVEYTSELAYQKSGHLLGYLDKKEYWNYSFRARPDTGYYENNESDSSASDKKDEYIQQKSTSYVDATWGNNCVASVTYVNTDKFKNNYPNSTVSDLQQMASMSGDHTEVKRKEFSPLDYMSSVELEQVGSSACQHILSTRIKTKYNNNIEKIYEHFGFKYYTNNKGEDNPIYIVKPLEVTPSGSRVCLKVTKQTYCHKDCTKVYPYYMIDGDQGTTNSKMTFLPIAENWSETDYIPVIGYNGKYNESSVNRRGFGEELFYKDSITVHPDHIKNGSKGPNEAVVQYENVSKDGPEKDIAGILQNDATSEPAKYTYGTERMNDIIIHSPIAIKDVVISPTILRDHRIFSQQRTQDLSNPYGVIRLTPGTDFDLQFVTHFTKTGTVGADGLREIVHDKSLNYLEGLSTNRWIDQRYVRLPVGVTVIKGASSSNCSLVPGTYYPAGKAIPICPEGEHGANSVRFHIPVTENETFYYNENNGLQAWVIAKNNRPETGEGYPDKNPRQNWDRFSEYNAKHMSYFHKPVEVVGRIGNFTWNYTTDPQWQNYFRTPKASNRWVINGFVKEPNMDKMNYYVGDRFGIYEALNKNMADSINHFSSQYRKTLLGDEKIYNDGKAVAGVLYNQQCPTGKFKDAIALDPIKMGYPVYYTLHTIGNYFDPNARVWIQPEYYLVDDPIKKGKCNKNNKFCCEEVPILDGSGNKLDTVYNRFIDFDEKEEDRLRLYALGDGQEYKRLDNNFVSEFMWLSKVEDQKHNVVGYYEKTDKKAYDIRFGSNWFGTLAYQQLGSGIARKEYKNSPDYKNNQVDYSQKWYGSIKVPSSTKFVFEHEDARTTRNPGCKEIDIKSCFLTESQLKDKLILIKLKINAAGPIWSLSASTSQSAVPLKSGQVLDIGNTFVTWGGHSAPTTWDDGGTPPPKVPLKPPTGLNVTPEDAKKLNPPAGADFGEVDSPTKSPFTAAKQNLKSAKYSDTLPFEFQLPIQNHAADIIIQPKGDPKPPRQYKPISNMSSKDEAAQFNEHGASNKDPNHYQTNKPKYTPFVPPHPTAKPSQVPAYTKATEGGVILPPAKSDLANLNQPVYSSAIYPVRPITNPNPYHPGQPIFNNPNAPIYVPRFIFDKGGSDTVVGNPNKPTIPIVFVYGPGDTGGYHPKKPRDPDPSNPINSDIKPPKDPKDRIYVPYKPIWPDPSNPNVPIVPEEFDPIKPDPNLPIKPHNPTPTPIKPNTPRPYPPPKYVPPGLINVPPGTPITPKVPRIPIVPGVPSVPIFPKTPPIPNRPGIDTPPTPNVVPPTITEDFPGGGTPPPEPPDVPLYWIEIPPPPENDTPPAINPPPSGPEPPPDITIPPIDYPPVPGIIFPPDKPSSKDIQVRGTW